MPLTRKVSLVSGSLVALSAVGALAFGSAATSATAEVRQTPDPKIAAFERAGSRIPSASSIEKLGEVLAGADPARIGQVRLQGSRELLAPSENDFGMRIVAALTSSGSVCYMDEMQDRRGGSCTPNLNADGLAYTVSIEHPGVSPAVLAGVAEDGIVAVSVSADDGTTSKASMGANAFGWSGPAGRRPVKLVATYTDGSERTLDVDAPAVSG